MKYIGQKTAYQPEQDSKVGILLCNLGTPQAPTAKALRSYLREFLSDPRVVEIPRIIWWFILNLIILPLRPAKSAKLYQQVWTEQGSPLLTYSQAQLEKLQQTMLADNKNQHLLFALGMRYGQPSIDNAIAQLIEQGAEQIIVLPLYPQYCGATTGSTFDAVADTLKKYRKVPQLTFINQYQQNPLYIQALCSSIEQHIAQHGQPEKILFSYHGTPEYYRDQGDPYYYHCQQTTAAVQQQLQLKDEQFEICFQSRFGKTPWLKPYADDLLNSLPEQGTKNIAVICPGFAADCLETIEEIAQEGKETFLAAGGESYHYIPALNTDQQHIDALINIVERYI